ncbi:sodium-independent sulfate anion transporter [Planococcus citri]|uniref:sodium-independent sulfate anion transporter n=1 Tax=Planococcus citri TaxID=170843 RepID=UPI0031FA05C3
MSMKLKKNDLPFWKKKLYRRVPILSWIKRYTIDDAVSDVIAGITVGLTVMPQSLAYATLAGLDPQYGLYSAFAGCIVYCLFGSCKDITIGPTALMSLMTYQQVAGRNADFAVLLCFLTGIIQWLMGFFHLGVLIDFISIPVTVGFTSATSVIIAVSQLKGLLGLKFESNGGFLDALINVHKHIHETQWTDCSLGIICIFVLLVLRKIKDIAMRNNNPNQTDQQRYIRKALWLLSTARNAIVVILCSLVVYIYYDPTKKPVVVLTGHVKSGLPSISLPPFSTNVGETHLSFFKMCTELGSSIVLVPVIAVLGNVAIAKAFASGDSIDATQELYTLGICNVLGSFFSSMPVTGSFSRSAVNHASGVRSPMGGLYTGILILLALSLLTPYFFYIPKASLAAVIICAVIFMIEYEVVKPMWKSSRKDLIPTFATFVLCLVFGVELGILIGVGINIILLLIPSARPFLHYEKTRTTSGHEFVMVTPGNSLYFPAVDFLRTKVGKIGIKDGYSRLPVVIDCRHILGADFTAAKGIKCLIEDFKKRNQPLYFYNPHPHVLEVLNCVSLDDFDEISTMKDLDLVLQNKKRKSKPNSNQPVTSDGGEECSVSRRSTKSTDADEPLLLNGGNNIELK